MPPLKMEAVRTLHTINHVHSCFGAEAAVRRHRVRLAADAFLLPSFAQLTERVCTGKTITDTYEITADCLGRYARLLPQPAVLWPSAATSVWFCGPPPADRCCCCSALPCCQQRRVLGGLRRGAEGHG